MPPKISDYIKQRVTNALTKNNCTLIDIEPTKKRVTYMCSCGNESSGFVQYLTTKWQGHCRKCARSHSTDRKVKTLNQNTQDTVISILVDNNCQLISFEKGRVVRYTCSCGNDASTNIQSIMRDSWGGCVKCSNVRRGNKNNFEIVRQLFAKHDIVLPIQPYQNNKTKLSYICPNCNEEAHVSLSEFCRGRRCENCAKSRARQTNIENTGFANPFQASDFKEKRKATNQERYGVDHHM